MPPKKDPTESSDLITGFSEKECKLLAAAFISSTGPDKYDYDLMAALTKNTAGSLKKMWPPIKKKAMETYASFATFLGQASTAAANSEPKPVPAPKAASGKKRKAADENEEENDPNPNLTSDGNKSDTPKKKTAPKKTPAAKGKGRAKKVVKKESTSSDEAQVQAENSADGGDGLGQEIEDEV